MIWASTAAASESSGSGRVSSDSISDRISTPPACNKIKNKISLGMKVLEKKKKQMFLDSEGSKYYLFNCSDLEVAINKEFVNNEH